MRRMKKTKLGCLTDNGVRLLSHETQTVNRLLKMGKDIELIPPSNTPSRKMPDLEMDGVEWEMKSPIRGSYIALKRLTCAALAQSENLIFDLRRIRKRSDEELAETNLRILYEKFRRQRLIVISGNVNDLIALCNHN